MEKTEFELLLSRVMYLSDKSAGLKVQNKILLKRNAQLEAENVKLSRKLTQVNHNLNKASKEFTDLTQHVYDLKHENERLKARLVEVTGEAEVE
jgi:regulator of replication initiation timing